jgi:hypothetical protein
MNYLKYLSDTDKLIQDSIKKHFQKEEPEELVADCHASEMDGCKHCVKVQMTERD